MKIIHLLFLNLLAFSLKAQKPNVIIIYADDLGYGDVSAYKQGTLKTPNMDKLAKSGVRFTNAYATSSTCTPSRFALLSGIYPWRNPKAQILPGDAPMLLDTSKTTLADIFQANGYTTAIVGKWHLGLGNGSIDWNKEMSPTPNDLGFEYSYVMAATNDRVPSVYIKNRKVDNLDPKDPLFVSYKEPFAGEPTALTNPELMTKQTSNHNHSDAIYNGVPRIGFMKGGKSALWQDETMYEVFLNQAKNVIENAGQKPFFLYYALHQPHAPRIPNPKFVNSSGMGPRGDVIVEADYCIGEILKTLETKGLMKNTIICLSSDNGPVLNDGYNDQAVEKLGNHTPAGVLRGGKYSLFEAGTKVPFIMSGATIAKGKVSNALISQVDLLASFAELLQVKAPTNDSQNYWNVLTGKSENGREALVIESFGRLGFRYKNYAFLPANKGNSLNKNVNIETGYSETEQLYDLDKDPSQKNNIATQNPELVKDIRKRFLESTAKK
jgi:arylsulfatase A-like enzyme